MSLHIENLSVVYRNGHHSIQAVEGVSLAVEPGQCVALVGESGSGKTTLGKTCLGLLPKNADVSGRVLLMGREIDFSDEPALNQIRWKNLSMVFQDGVMSLNPVHRIIDQVAEPVLQHEHPAAGEAMERAARCLEGMGLSRADQSRYPHQLSGGQIQRALLAMALILDPEVVILDEPTSALDALTKGFVAQSIRHMKERGKGILLITHDLEFAVRHAETIAVLYLGQVMETLPSSDLLLDPLHPYTMALGRSYPAMDTARDLGGIRGDAFYRLVHQHGRRDKTHYSHSHIQVPESSHKNGHAPPTGCLFQDRCTQAIEACKTHDVALEPVGRHTVRCLRRGIVNRLELEGVSKTYGETSALKPVDLDVRAGEIMALVGETGSGKTTLAMIAAGILAPDQGRRTLSGQDMDEWAKRDAKALARKIGVIYQNPAQAVSHRFTVLDAVAEPLRIHKVSRDKDERLERVKTVLRAVHLSTDASFLKRYPHELNLGALQRVSLARALVLNPPVVIADEPTSALDPSVQAKVLKLLLDLQIEMGLTMLFVSHDIGLARKISDRMGVMLQGGLVESGPASLVISRPLHPYTRLLIDSAAGRWNGGRDRFPGERPEAGCAFRTRCPQKQARCEKEAPSFTFMDHRRVACHFPLV